VDGEIWRDVPSVPGILVSSEGRVMHTPYRGPLPNGGERPYGGQPAFWRVGQGCRPLHHQHSRSQLQSAPADRRGVPRPAAIRRAMAMHVDENAANNRPSNLYLNADGFLAYCHGRTGENSPTIKARHKANSEPET
jgi:hypothetical protein